MTLDTLITNGQIITPTTRFRGSIGIVGEQIAGIYEPGAEPEARETIDASGLTVLPGLVDVHSHHREPGFGHKEDIVTVTQQCAAGGVTTSVAMPNVDPPPTTVERLKNMFELYEGRALIDYNVNPAPTEPDEMAGLAEMGILSFKIFMVTDTGRDYPHMPGIGVHDNGRLMGMMEQCRELGVPLMVHPHDQAVMDHIEEGFWERGERDYRAYAKAYAAHSGVAWDTAIGVLLRLQEATGVHLHVLHAQTKRTVEMFRAAKDRGQKVSAEINPWALFLGHDWENIERLGSYALSYWVAEEHHEALWSGINDSTIDIVATDHAPHTREEKDWGWEDGWKAHTGTPSTQFYLSLLLDAASKGKIPLEQVVEVSSAAPARLFGLGQKGRIESGADADLVLVDLEREHTITEDEVLSKCGWTPYEGVTVKGWPVRTLLRGRTIFDEATGVTDQATGKQARRTVEA